MNTLLNCGRKIKPVIMPAIIIILVIILGYLIDRKIFEVNRKRRKDYYKNVYLKSEAWKRKRYVVLKRDNWKCVKCGAPATQVHHKRYAKWNIGREPIHWLISVCKPCHEVLHKN